MSEIDMASHDNSTLSPTKTGSNSQTRRRHHIWSQRGTKRNDGLYVRLVVSLSRDVSRMADFEPHSGRVQERPQKHTGKEQALDWEDGTIYASEV